MTDDIVKVEQEIRLGIIPAKTPHDVIVQATIIAKELAKIVKDNRLSRNIQGREYVYVEGWSTMGAMLGVLPREVPELVKRYEDGGYEATVELIRITDNAVIGRASAYVGMDEKDRNGRLTWGSRPEYARRSMAVTRATGKAYRLGFSWIMGLAGYAPTPAEEMDGVVDGEYREVEPERKPAPPKQEAPASTATAIMYPPELEVITNSKGVPYTELDSDTLSHMSRSIGKSLNDPDTTDDAKATLSAKAQAIREILALRIKAQVK